MQRDNQSFIRGLVTLPLALSGTLIWTALSCAPPPAAKPNIVVIFADDLGYGDLSSYGATRVQTPHCDRLAREGMRFTDAHSPSAVCSPSRYALLTGRYAWRTWLKNWVLSERMPLLVDTDRLTLPKMLKQLGYLTGAVGKWHLGWGEKVPPDFNDDSKIGPLDVGFDSFFGVAYSHNSSLMLRNFVRDRRTVGLDPSEDIQDPEVQQRLARRLEDTAVELSREAVKFIRDRRDVPFFLYYPTTNVHWPRTPNERFQGKSQAGLYGDFVVEFDWAVGEVTRELDELGLTDNTLVVLTSDNGGRPTDGMNGHRPNGDLKGIKRQIWEGGHRVPLIVRWPGTVAAGSTSDETVCLTDLMATLAAYFGSDLPENAAEDSVNLLPVLRGEAYSRPLREATVHHSVAGMFALRQGDWKLVEGDTDGDFRPGHNAAAAAMNLPIKDPATGGFQAFTYDILDFDQENPVYRLYNLHEDPAESTDVAAENPEKVAELRGLLESYRQSERSVPAR
ncbi:MAG: arylsulfatase [Bryobacterales bacterium]|nr:arylsulfatase [Bryobacterales bacterium]